MSSAATPAPARRAATAPPAASVLLDRFLAAVPLLVGVLALGILYAWLAWSHRTPWLFTDELEMTQISRAIAETGHPARRGVPYEFTSLVPFFTAPAWLVDDTKTAYDIAKYIGVAAMLSTAFPAYWLARTIVPQRWALYAAVATVGVPALAYSSQLLEEPFAYPAATLAFFLFVKALATRRLPWIAGAGAGAIGAMLVRDQLLSLVAVLGLSAILFALSSDRARAWRNAWSVWDWVGAGTLVALASIVVWGGMSSYSHEWLVATRYYNGRVWEYGLWAAGALTIGLGLLPVMAGLASLGRPRGEVRTPELRAFRSVLAAGVAGIWVYAAVKAAYLSTIFSTLVVERNVIYVTPLLMAGTAWWLHGRRLRTLPTLASIGVVAYLVASTPNKMDQHLYFEAFGFAFLAQLNRLVALDLTGAGWLLGCMTAIGAAVLLAPRLARGRRARRAVAGAGTAAALLALAWGIAGGVSAGLSSNDFSQDFIDNLPADLRWLDHATGGEPAFYLGQGVKDPNGVHQLEFWNRSLKKVWSLDGTAPSPGPILTPDLGSPDGQLSPDPGYRYAVVGPGVDVVGDLVAAPAPIDLKLIRIAPPLRLHTALVGVEGDGWTTCQNRPCTSTASFDQFSTPGHPGPGFIEVTVSRFGWTGPNAPGKVTVHVGTLVIDGNNQPAMGEVTQTRTWVAKSGQKITFTIPAPAAPFRVELESDVFSPHEVDPNISDSRLLGVQPAFRFVTQPAADRLDRQPGF